MLRRLGPHGSYFNADRVFVAGLSLYGPFYQVPEVLYFRREHPNRLSRASTRDRAAGLDPRGAAASGTLRCGCTASTSPATPDDPQGAAERAGPVAVQRRGGPLGGSVAARIGRTASCTAGRVMADAMSGSFESGCSGSSAWAT